MIPEETSTPEYNMENTSTPAVVYACSNKKCREFRKEFKSVDPGWNRAWTRSSVSCPRCGQVARFVRQN